MADPVAPIGALELLTQTEQQDTALIRRSISTSNRAEAPAREALNRLEAALQQARQQLAEKVDEWIEREAACCPEGASFEQAGLFPVMGGPAIPWSMVAPHERQAWRNHNQTLQRLSDRGGLSPSEVVAVLEDREWRQIDHAEALRQLDGFIHRDLSAKLQAAEAAEQTVKSLAVMLGWDNVPLRDTLERSLAALTVRAARGLSAIQRAEVAESALQEARDEATVFILIADGAVHDHRCPRNAATQGTGLLCLRCQLEEAQQELTEMPARQNK